MIIHQKIFEKIRKTAVKNEHIFLKCAIIVLQKVHKKRILVFFWLFLGFSRAEVDGLQKLW